MESAHPCAGTLWCLVLLRLNASLNAKLTSEMLTIKTVDMQLLATSEYWRTELGCDDPELLLTG